MVGDGNVFVSPIAGGGGHFLERGTAVGLGSVHVYIAADVTEFNELRQAAFESGFDFAGILAKLGRNPWETDGRVDFLFGCSGDAGFAVDAEQAILAKLEAHFHGARA